MVEPTEATAKAVAVPAATIRPPAPASFERYFRDSFPELVRSAMTVGATRQEGEDAAAKALADILVSWGTREFTLAYARKATVHNFIKDKTRGNPRLISRLIERGHVPVQEGAIDRRLTELEDQDWVADVLSILPPAEREVMGCIADGFDRDQIAEKLGKTRQAVRTSLCSARARLAQVLHPDGEHKQDPPVMAPRSRKEVR